DEIFKIMEMNKKIFANIHPSIFYDLQKYHATTWQLWNNHKNEFILHQIKENIWRGIREGLFRSDLDVEVMGRLRLAQVDIVFNADVFPPQQFDARKVQMEVVEHFMLGIATLKGHKLINKYKEITEEE
ncbi:MAG: TetR/AcrR family transcriptional regulator, partial [Hymenobacteraceae bacterium]|nr:TetR/AcrR family transcriptional regulator [Hymenobacteraceae bacterium]